ncbi:MAG: CD225/dispanin family protein [Bacteroidales bacterium]|jgi:hypothetical protein|nr:CD225/dispanin family protein [Bacteroidales bacterium]
MAKEYHIAVDGQRQGPFSIDDLRGLGISEETLVWHKGWENWQKAGDTPELAPLFRAAPPPVPGSGHIKAPQVTVSYQTSPQPANYNGQYMKKPNNYIVWAIITLVISPLCGIIALVHAGRVNRRWYSSDLEGAAKSSGKAMGWCIAGIVFNLIMILILSQEN